jgi:hypothetical protein
MMLSLAGERLIPMKEYQDGEGLHETLELFCGGSFALE